MKRIISLILAVAAVGALAVPALASANSSQHYYLTKAQAERNVQDIAEDHYSGNGVTVDDTYCRTQDSRQSGRGYGYSHRWVCTWTGTDEDAADVYGSFRITGHSGYYGWLPLYGGLRWS